MKASSFTRHCSYLAIPYANTQTLLRVMLLSHLLIVLLSAYSSCVWLSTLFMFLIQVEINYLLALVSVFLGYSRTPKFHRYFVSVNVAFFESSHSFHHLVSVCHLISSRVMRGSHLSLLLFVWYISFSSFSTFGFPT